MSESYHLSTKSFKIKHINRHDCFSMKINTKFLLLKPDSKNEIKIYNLSTLSFFQSLKLNNINYYDFHNYYENIFFSCDGKDIMIYEINLENKIVNNISKIQGHFSDVEYANFNPLEHNIFVSITENYFIKIFDLTKYLPISHVFIDQPFDYQPFDYQLIKWGKNNIGVLSEKKILTFDYKYFKKSFINEFPFDDDIIDFHFFNDNNLIVLLDNDIFFIDGKKKNIYKSESNIRNNFYHKRKNKLILFCSNYIIILSIDYFKAKEDYKLSQQNTLPCPVFIEESLLNENELYIAYYSYTKNHDIIDQFSITINKSNKEEKIDNASKDEQIKEFLKNIIKNISDIQFLISAENNDISDNNYILNKKYFEYEEIKDELKLIKTRDIFERKKIVKNNIIKIKDFNDVKEKYIYILKLLVNDNTNKSLIITYLEFLNKKEEQLKSIIMII